MTINRRDLFRSTAAAAAGLFVSFHIPRVLRPAAAATPQLPPSNAFLRIGTDDSVTVLIAHSEMGQGI